MKRNGMRLLIGIILVIVTACIPHSRMVQEWKIKAVNSDDSFYIESHIFDAEGNSILACNNIGDWNGIGRLIKINRKGEIIFSVDLPARISAAADANGYLYVVGYRQESSETGTVYRAVLVKYNPAGEQVWIIYDTPGIGLISMSGISIDKNLDIIVFGRNSISKFNPDGELLWGQAISTEKISTDSAGDIYAIDGADLYKISGSSGELIWKKEIENSGADHDFCYLRSLTIDSNDNAIVLGSSGKSIDDISSYPERIDGHSFLIKYAQDGSQLWEQTYPNPESATAIWTYADSSDVTVDSQGYIIATFEGVVCNLYMPVPNPVIWTTIAIVGVGSSHAEIAKYDTEGNLLWKQKADSGGINEPRYGRLYIDRQDGIYLNSYNRLFRYDQDGGFISSLIKCPLELGSHGLSQSSVDVDGNQYLYDTAESRNCYLARYKQAAVPSGE